jgi:hypothetical protein
MAVNASQISRAQELLAADGMTATALPTAKRAALASSADMDVAIDVRLRALRFWADRHQGFAWQHLVEAAAVAPLVETEQGLAFDDATFGDLVSFAAEIPW